MSTSQQLILAVATKKTNGGEAANLFLLAAFGILILLFMRSRKNQKQRTERLRSSIEVGQRVMTSSGIIARIVDSDDESYSLEVADGVVIKFVKAAVTKVLPEPLNPDHLPDETPDTVPDPANASSDS